MRRWIVVLMVLCLLLGAVGLKAQAEPLRVLATTSIVADIAAQVAGELADVEALLPVGADPHLYEPATDDALKVAQADVVLVVGAGYESFMQRLLENAGADVPVVEVNHGVSILPLGAVQSAAAGEAPAPLGRLGVTLACSPEGLPAPEMEVRTDCDPHTWMNPLNIIAWAQTIAEALAAADPAHADAYYERAVMVGDDLLALDAELAAMVETIPPANRRLLTNHENLQYFAARYGFEQVAVILPGGSSEGELDAQTLAALIAQVQAEGVPAVFADITANTAFAETVATDAGITLVTGLYIEALSAADGPAATYSAMMRSNTALIAAALS